MTSLGKYLAGLALLLTSCSSFRTVSDTRSLKEDERILLGEIEYVDLGAEDMDDKPEKITGFSVRGHYESPIKDGNLAEPEDGKVIDSSPPGDLNGGKFQAVVSKRKPFYIYGFYLQFPASKDAPTDKNAQLVWVPLPYRVSPGTASCVYIGSISIQNRAGRLVAMLKDRSHELHDAFKTAPKGCRVKKHLAKSLQSAVRITSQ